jgi:hypothetical protein
VNPVISSEKPRLRAYRCPTCKFGLVIPHSRDGRFVSHRNVLINLPMSVFVPTCNRCRAEFLDPETEKRMNEALEKEFARHENEIKAAYERLRRRKGNN